MNEKSRGVGLLLQARLRLRRFNDKYAIGFKIFAQDESIRRDSDHAPPLVLHRQKNGWGIRSCSHPEIEKNTRMVFLRGNRNTPLVKTKEEVFSAPYVRKQYAEGNLAKIIDSFRSMTEKKAWHIRTTVKNDGIYIMVYRYAELLPIENIQSRELFEPEE